MWLEGMAMSHMEFTLQTGSRNSEDIDKIREKIRELCDKLGLCYSEEEVEIE